MIENKNTKPLAIQTVKSSSIEDYSINSNIIYEATSTTYSIPSNTISTSSVSNRLTFVKGKAYDYNEVFTNFFNNSNKIKHLIYGSKGSRFTNRNHNWDILVPNYDELEIKKIVDDVIKHGIYKQRESKTPVLSMSVTNNGITKEVQIAIYINEQGIFTFSNGWVIV